MTQESTHLLIQTVSEDGFDHYQYKIIFSPFSIEQIVNDIPTITVNHKSTLFFENSEFFYGNDHPSDTDK